MSGFTMGRIGLATRLQRFPSGIMHFLNQHTSKYQKRSKHFVCTRFPGSSMFSIGWQPDYKKYLKLLRVAHFETLMNLENEREETDMINKTEGPVQDVTREEVNMALSKITNGKACRSSEVKALGKYGTYCLHAIQEGQRKDGWRESQMVQI